MTRDVEGIGWNLPHGSPQDVAEQTKSQTPPDQAHNQWDWHVPLAASHVQVGVTDTRDGNLHTDLTLTGGARSISAIRTG